MANKDIYFRADIARGGAVRVNRKEEVIEGFAVVTKGVTHDERGEFDDIGLDSVVVLGNKIKPESNQGSVIRTCRVPRSVRFWGGRKISGGTAISSARTCISIRPLMKRRTATWPVMS